MTTRRKAQPKPEAIDEPNDVHADQAFEPLMVPRFNLAGCMTPIMFFTIITMFGFMVWDRSQPVVQPVPVVVPMPTIDLSSFTAPITTKLTTDKAKSAIIADAYTGLRDALKGVSGKRVTDSRVFEAVSKAFLTDLDAKGGVSVGAEIDAAIGSYLGMVRSTEGTETGWEPIQLDDAKRAKLVEIVGAIANAAEGVR